MGRNGSKGLPRFWNGKTRCQQKQTKIVFRNSISFRRETPSKALCNITFLRSVYRSEPTVRRESRGPLTRKPEAGLTWHGDFRIQPSHRPLRERGEHIVRSGETSNQRKIHGSGNSSGFVPTRSASPCLPVPTQRVH